MGFRYALGLILAILISVSAQGESKTIRQVDMGIYTVLTDVKDTDKIDEWIAKFDLTRRAIQQIAGIVDEQVMPLTVLLLDKKEDFWSLLTDYRMPTDGSFYVHTGQGFEIRVMTAGLAQQPMLALSIRGGWYNEAKNIRAAVAMWLLTSSGVTYDHWVIQGIVHMIEDAKIRDTSITLGGSIFDFRKTLWEQRSKSYVQLFDIDSMSLRKGIPWLAVHYMTIRDGKWFGLGQIKEYQQRAAVGEARDSAFGHAFGCTVQAMDELVQAHLRKGPFKAVTVDIKNSRNTRPIVIKPAELGLWQIMVGSFRLLQNANDEELGYRMIQEAMALMPPDDPRPYEALWIHAERMYQPQRAYEAIVKAVECGSKNNYIGAQWGVRLISRGLNETGGLIMPPAEARRAADIFVRIADVNAVSLSSYRTLAYLIPSIYPTRESDRRVLEQGLQAFYTRDKLIALGLAAWSWRNGELMEARRQIDGLSIGTIKDPAIRHYAQWLNTQLILNTVIEQVKSAMAEGDFAQAQIMFSEITVGRSTAPFLKEEWDAQRLVIDYCNLALRAQEHWENGNRAGAEVLLSELSHGDLPAPLRLMVDDLKKAMGQL